MAACGQVHWVNDVNLWSWLNHALFGAGTLERLHRPAPSDFDANGLVITGPHEAVALLSAMPAQYDIRVSDHLSSLPIR